MLKLQIDLKTLEDMIGGDTPFHVDIRNSIVQTFAKRYLKEVVNTEIMQEALRDVRKELSAVKKALEEEIFSILPVQKAGPYRAKYCVSVNHPAYKTFMDDAKETLQRHVKDNVNLIFNQIYMKEKEYIDSRQKVLSSQIKKEVEAQLDKTFQQQVDLEVKRRLSKIAKEVQKSTVEGESL